MLIHYQDTDRWFVASELGPEDSPPRREITAAEGRRMRDEILAGEKRRLEDNERAKAPEYVI